MLTVGGATGAGTGKLHLVDNALVIDYDAGNSPLATVADLIESGRAGGSWGGNGITSSSANSSTFSLAYAEAYAVLGSAGGRTVDGRPCWYGTRDTVTPTSTARSMAQI